MDEALGRTFADGDYGAATAELRSRLRERIDELLATESDAGLRVVLADVRAATAKPEADLSIQQFGLLGRMIAEAMAGRLCHDLGLTPGASAFGNIEKLQAQGSISKWIHSYLHRLRILGNESVHIIEN